MAISIDCRMDFQKTIEEVQRRRRITGAHLRTRALSRSDEIGRTVMEKIKTAEDNLQEAYVILFSSENAALLGEE